MGTSFVAIGKAGFWMRDGVLELWLRLLALHVEEPTDADGLAGQIRTQWLLASRGFFTGCVPDGIEEAVSTNEGEAVVRGAIRSLMAVLEAAPDHLDKGVLNLLGIQSGSFQADFETRRLIQVGNAFMDLLDGKITDDASTTSFMPGSR